MNILGIVSFILLILGIGFFSIFQQNLSVDLACKSTRGYLHACREVQRLKHQKYFKQLTGKQTYPPKKPASPKQAPSPPKKKRKKEAFSSCSRINLSFFLHKKISRSDPSYQLLKALLLQVYAPLFEEGVSVDQFLFQWQGALQKAYSHSPLIVWEKLEFPEEKMQHLYYLLLKGCKFYEKADPFSYPSLLHFIEFNSFSSSRICLPCISLELLEALLGKKAAQNLWEQKQDPLDRLELCSENLHFLAPSQMQTYEGLVVYQHTSCSEKWICTTDASTAVEVKIPYPKRLFTRDKRVDRENQSE